MQTQPIVALDGKTTNYVNLYNDEGNYLSTVSTKYKPVLHENIDSMVKGSLKTLGIDFDLKANYPHSGRDAFMIYTLEGINDKVKPRIILKNTYRAGTALKLITGSFTMACLNGAIVGQKFEEYTHTHTRHFGEDMFVNKIDTFCKSFPEHLNKLAKMEALEANVNTFFANWEASERDEKNIRDMFANRDTATATVNRKGNSLRDLYETSTEYYTQAKLTEGSRIKRLSYVNEIAERELALV